MSWDSCAYTSEIYNEVDDPLIVHTLFEAASFCEWAGVAAAHRNDIETAHVLLTLQRQLIRWEHHFTGVYGDGVRRAEMAETARAWSKHLLVLSGLLTQSKPEPSAT